MDTSLFHNDVMTGTTFSWATHQLQAAGGAARCLRGRDDAAADPDAGVRPSLAVHHEAPLTLPRLTLLHLVARAASLGAPPWRRDVRRAALRRLVRRIPPLNRLHRGLTVHTA